MFGVYPAVLQLQLHLPNMQSVTYNEEDNLEEVLSRPGSNKTTLTEYFTKNREERTAMKILYREFPEHYRWIKGRKVWQIRKQASGQIGRIVYANPSEGERYFLRVLLNHVRGATSYEDLRTVAGVMYSTFREACEKRGLIETDKSIDDCLTESITFQMPCALRRLFATILVFCEATHIRGLWDKHKDALGEDFSWDNNNTSTVDQMVLRDIGDMLHSMGKDIKDYGLPSICDVGDSSIDMMKEVREEQSVSIDQDHLDIFDSLNKEQRQGFDEIIQHVFANKSQVFFCVSIDQDHLDSMCSFTKQSGTAELLRRVSLIIWDEVAMTKRQCVETLDRSLQDIMECSLPFGGKVMVFGGDFRQVLPVVPRGTRAQVTDATLQRSYLWDKIKKIRLSQNMRAQSDPWFSQYLLRIGNGTEETIGDDYVRLPVDIVIGYTNTDVAVNTLIFSVFPSLGEHATSAAYMSGRAILSTKNEHVDRLNAMMIERFPSEEKVYHSFDTVVDDPSNHFPIDFLN
jgi:hypothetical protein